MFRDLSAWLLVICLCAALGCGGGDAASDSTAVADSSGAASQEQSAGGGMPASGMDPSGGMGAGGMDPAAGMGGAGMDPAAGAGAGEEGMDPANMAAGGGAGPDAAAMAAGYDAGGEGAGAAGFPGGDPATAGANAGAYPGGDPASAGANAGAYPGGDPASAGANAGAYPGGDPASAGANAGAYPGGDPASAGANAGAYPGANAGSAAGANPGEATATGYPGAEGASGGGAYPGAGAGPGQGGGAVASAKPPEGLEGKAYWSFKRGKDADAMKYLYAYGLSDDQGAQSVLSTIRWVPGLKRPSLAVRFGAGVQVTAPPTFKGDPKALGSTQKLPTRGGGGGRGGEGGFGDAGAGAEGAGGFGGEGGYGPGGFAGGGGGGGGGKAAGINPVLARNTGDLGEKLVAAYKERLMRGDYGAVLKKAAGEAPAPSGGGAGAYGAEAAGAQAGFGGGKFAGGYPGGGAGAGGGAQAGGGDVAQIAPGLTMLGVGSQKELLAKAKEAGVDVFLLFKVSIKPNPKTRLVINEASFALLDAKTGQSLADAKTRKKLPPSRKLTNMDVQKSRAAGKDDGIDREVDKLFAFVDANLKMVDLPAALNAENVLKRVGSLIAKPVDDKLPVLSEIRMYNVKGLLQDAHLSKAYEKVLGVDFGRMLATGTDEDKHKVVQRWLPDA